VEMLVVAATVSLLAAVMTPSVGWVRKEARRVSCASQLHGIGEAIATFASAHRFCLPPFAFSEITSGNLPLSGHWGGTEPADPTSFGRYTGGLRYVNLWALVAENIIEPQRLICPSAHSSLRGGGTSLFPYTTRFSTYCLRFPPSEDLFSSAPGLAYYRFSQGGLLGVYLKNAGGQQEDAGQGGGPGKILYQTVPLVRLDRRYRLASGVHFGDGVYDAASDVLLADAFWYQDYFAEPPPTAKAPSFPVRWSWSHGPEFNVLSGSGAAWTIADDGRVVDNSNAPGQTLLDTGMYFGKYAEGVWQFFDRQR